MMMKIRQGKGEQRARGVGWIVKVANVDAHCWRCCRCCLFTSWTVGGAGVPIDFVSTLTFVLSLDTLY